MSDYISICKSGDEQALENLISNYPSPVHLCFEPSDNDEITGLMHACFRGHYRIVRRLIELRCNIYDRSNDAGTAFLNACEGGHLDIAQLLVSAGACVHDRDKFGNTAVHMACHCTVHDNLGVLKWLVKECGIDPNLVDCFGASAIFVCVEGNHYANVARARFLVEECGVNINTRTPIGFTPLIAACQRFGNLHIVRWLVSAGANVNAQTYKENIAGRNALARATQNDDPALVFYLVEQCRVVVTQHTLDTLLRYGCNKWTLADYFLCHIGHRPPAPWRGA